MKKGVYTLLIHLPKEKRIRVGKKGKFLFPPGYYVYVGSGMGNLEARIRRYFNLKKLKWHIDFLVRKGKIIKVFYGLTSRRLECSLSKLIEKHSLQLIKKFGSSDCKCFSHLHFFPSKRRAENMIFKSFRRLKIKFSEFQVDNPQ